MYKKKKSRKTQTPKKRGKLVSLKKYYLKIKNLKNTHRKEGEERNCFGSHTQKMKRVRTLLNEWDDDH